MGLKHLLLSGIILMLTDAYSIAQQSDSVNPCFKLWYNTPAERWMTQAIPIGNGVLGAMISGGIDKAILR